MEKWFEQKLTHELKAAKIFTIFSDEGMDVAKIEKLPPIIRFVEPGMIRVEFLEFVLCGTGTCVQGIADNFKFNLAKLALTSMTFTVKDMMGQATCLLRREGMQASFNMIILRHYKSIIYYMNWACV